MIYLILAIASSAMISLVMRASEKYIQNTMGMFMANYALCLLLSRLYMGETGLAAAETGSGFALGLGVLNGMLYLLSFVLMKRSMSCNGAMLSSAFMKLGVIVPTLMAIFVFGEHPRAVQLLGIAMAILAVGLIQFEKEPGGAGKKKGLLPILLLVSGFTDSLANVYDKLGKALLKDHFLFFTFLAAFILAAVIGIAEKKAVRVKDLLFGCLIGIPNYFSARFFAAGPG